MSSDLLGYLFLRLIVKFRNYILQPVALYSTAVSVEERIESRIQSGDVEAAL